MEVKVLFHEKEIQTAVVKLAGELNKILDTPEEITVLSVLNGAFIFTADLVRLLNHKLRCEFIKASSYIGTSSSGAVDIYGNFEVSDIKGKTILLIEDIVDTGTTIKALKEYLTFYNPKAIYIVCLIDKPSKRKVDIKPDFIGFTIEDIFIAGYGMDYNGEYRSLPSIITID